MGIDKQKFAKQLGITIATYRQEKALTQEQLAEILGIGNEAISRIERGVAMPSLIRLIEIANVFHCSVADLIIRQSSSQKDELGYIASLLDGLSQPDRAFLIEIIEKLSGRIKKI